MSYTVVKYISWVEYTETIAKNNMLNYVLKLSICLFHHSIVLVALHCLALSCIVLYFLVLYCYVLHCSILGASPSEMFF